jgi:hypothetical protein
LAMKPCSTKEESAATTHARCTWQAGKAGIADGMAPQHTAAWYCLLAWLAAGQALSAPPLALWKAENFSATASMSASGGRMVVRTWYVPTSCGAGKAGPTRRHEREGPRPRNGQGTGNRHTLVLATEQRSRRQVLLPQPNPPRAACCRLAARRTWPKPDPGTVTIPVWSSSSMQYTKSGCLCCRAAALHAPSGMVSWGKA